MRNRQYFLFFIIFLLFIASVSNYNNNPESNYKKGIPKKNSQYFNFPDNLSISFESDPFSIGKAQIKQGFYRENIRFLIDMEAIKEIGDKYSLEINVSLQDFYSNKTINSYSFIFRYYLNNNTIYNLTSHQYLGNNPFWLVNNNLSKDDHIPLYLNKENNTQWGKRMSRSESQAYFGGTIFRESIGYLLDNKDWIFNYDINSTIIILFPVKIFTDCKCFFFKEYQYFFGSLILKDINIPWKSTFSEDPINPDDDKNNYYQIGTNTTYLIVVDFLIVFIVIKRRYSRNN